TGDMIEHQAPIGNSGRVNHANRARSSFHVPPTTPVAVRRPRHGMGCGGVDPDPCGVRGLEILGAQCRGL
ncbi:hypothetical protein ACW9HM_35940, partial [Nocardia gipuzkoensis]